jgi:hypothetical protein
MSKEIEPNNGKEKNVEPRSAIELELHELRQNPRDFNEHLKRMTDPGGVGFDAHSLPGVELIGKGIGDSAGLDCWNQDKWKERGWTEHKWSERGGRIGSALGEMIGRGLHNANELAVSGAQEGFAAVAEELQKPQKLIPDSDASWGADVLPDHNGKR